MYIYDTHEIVYRYPALDLYFSSLHSIVFPNGIRYQRHDIHRLDAMMKVNRRRISDLSYIITVSQTTKI
jgi:hypothetical protein